VGRSVRCHESERKEILPHPWCCPSSTPPLATASIGEVSGTGLYVGFETSPDVAVLLDPRRTRGTVSSGQGALGDTLQARVAGSRSRCPPALVGESTWARLCGGWASRGQIGVVLRFEIPIAVERRGEPNETLEVSDPRDRPAGRRCPLGPSAPTRREPCRRPRRPCREARCSKPRRSSG